MNPDTQDKWAALVSALDTMTRDRGTEPPQLIAPLLGDLMKAMLAFCYDRDTTPEQVEAVGTMMKLCYQYGKSNQHLNDILKRV